MFRILNNIKSFQTHLISMKAFRQSHGRLAGEGIRSEEKAPGRRILLLHLIEGTIVVPIWKIEIPPGVKN